MTELEQQVWAAAYANEFAKVRKYYASIAHVGNYGIDNIDGYECGAVADVAVLKLREALCGPGGDLLPVKEVPGRPKNG